MHFLGNNNIILNNLENKWCYKNLRASGIWCNSFKIILRHSNKMHEWLNGKLKCPKPDKTSLFHLCWLCGCSANLIMTSQVCWRHRRHPLSTALSAWSHGNHLHDMDKDMMFGRYLVIAWVWVPICSTVNTHISVTSVLPDLNWSLKIIDFGLMLF